VHMCMGCYGGDIPIFRGGPEGVVRLVDWLVDAAGPLLWGWIAAATLLPVGTPMDNSGRLGGGVLHYNSAAGITTPLPVCSSWSALHIHRPEIYAFLAAPVPSAVTPMSYEGSDSLLCAEAHAPHCYPHCLLPSPPAVWPYVAPCGYPFPWPPSGAQLTVHTRTPAGYTPSRQPLVGTPVHMCVHMHTG